ncbi:MAG: SRPBCC domain-containing protein [Candidatus Bathyarchaeia archaeon]|jgi:uncharacterized protein YndB with AHSA1/START domain
MTEVLHVSVVLHCDSHEAYEMFTVNRLLESWLITPFSEGGHAEIEPVLGGRYELFWEPTDRENNSTVGCKVTAIQPDKVLAFDWKGPAEFKHLMNTADPLTHVVISFIPNGESPSASTDVHLIHSGWGNSPDWKEARHYFLQAWSGAFRKLEKIVNE